MQNDPNIRQALIDYIVLNDRSRSQAKLAGHSILELIVIKTELELQKLKAKTIIP